MTPRKDSDFYKLKQSYEKICYLNGMPKNYIKITEKEPEFCNFKSNSKIITALAQKKAFEDLKTNPWGPSHTAFWLAHPNDKRALEASCQVIKRKAQEGFKSFEFISAFEDLRFQKNTEPKDLKDLYIILGAHEADVEMTQRIRRWVRQPHGAAVWVVGIASDPYKWASEQLGCIPHFMFWLKKAGISVG